MRRRARQERRALVDLIERVGADHSGRSVAVDHRLDQGKDAFAGSVHRDNIALRREGARRQLETPRGPVSDGFTKFVGAFGAGVVGQFVEVVGNHLFYKVRRGVLWFADTQ